MKSLHSRLRSILWLLALPAVVLVVLQAFWERNEVINSSKVAAERIAGSLAMEQKRLIDETHFFLRRLAQAPQVQQPEAGRCSEFLASALKLTQAYVNLGVPQADGQLLCNALPLRSAVDVGDRVYFQQARDERRFSVSTLQYDRAAAVPSMNFAYPVQPHGKNGPVVGVAVAVVSLTWWSEQLGRQSPPEGVIAFVVDSTDHIVAHFPNDPAKQAKPIQDLGLGGFRSLGDGNDIFVGEDGRRRLYHRANLFDDGGGSAVYVGVGIPIDNALAAANFQALRSLVILFFFGFVLLALVRHWTQRSILQPLQDLKREVQAGGRAKGHNLRAGDVEEFTFLSTEFAKARGGRRAAERAEVMRREQLEAVLDALPDMYFRLDQNYVILDYKAHEKGDLLIPPDEIVGTNVLELLPPEALEQFRDNIVKHEESREVVCWEYMVPIDNTERHFEARACAVHGGRETILVIRDITGRRKAQEAMHLAAMVYESSSEGMVVADAAQKILTTNPALTRLIGREASDLLGVHLRKMVPREMRRKLKSGFARAENGGKGWGGEVQILGREDYPIPVWLTINAIFDEKGHLYRYVILVRDMTAQKKANETIWKQAHVDVLTGLLNRAALGEHLEALITDAMTNSKDLALLFVDLDGLKQVNDRQGHAAGDLVLKEVARRLKSCLSDKLTLARYGGDEFIVVLDHLHVSQLNEVVETVLEKVAIPFGLTDEVVHLTASLGIARYPEDAVAAEDLISAADQAMYAAKSSGRNRAVPFSPRIRRAVLDKMNLVSDLQKAVHDKEMDVYFQPIVDFRTGRLCKAEALLRWTHASLGQVSPAQFIPLAEEAGLIDQLGDLVFEKCCKALPDLRARFGDGFQISINVSPLQLTASTRTFQNWIGKLDECGQDGSGFVIEITENALLDTQSPVVARVEALQRAGFQLALDDFGKGYSSLFYFLKHRIDYLKIDQAFVRSLSGSRKAETLCRSMVEMAHRLKVQVVAEGIETESQCAFLAQIGSDFGQGFLFAHPCPLDELLGLPVILHHMRDSG